MLFKSAVETDNPAGLLMSHLSPLSQFPTRRSLMVAVRRRRGERQGLKLRSFVVIALRQSHHLTGQWNQYEARRFELAIKQKRQAVVVTVHLVILDYRLQIVAVGN